MQVRVMLGFFGGHLHEGVVATLPFAQGHVSFAFTVYAVSAVGIAMPGIPIGGERPEAVQKAVIKAVRSAS